MTDAAEPAPRPRHRPVVADEPGDIEPASVTPGPIAVVPTAEPPLVAAVQREGGTVAPLSASTRGIVWTAASGADSLGRLLHDHPHVSWVQLPWAGVDAFADLLASARDDGRVWTSAKGAYAQPVAEHALMLALSLARVLPRRVAAHTWEADEVGRTLYGAEVVIVGAGGIAVEVLRLLEPFGVHATVVRRRAMPVAGASRTVTVAELGSVLASAEVLFVAAALTRGSRGLIGRAELERMPRGALLVNVARGGLVDSEALLDALETGRIGGAGLDVTDPEPLPDGHPLWTAPNCIVTPHVADTHAMTVPLYAERIARNTRAFLGDGRFEGRIDLAAGY
ncbi:D-isomer specific 2-hydroxyacid dehydrogenase family protein [Agromyces ramosus]|uniref:Phosphoglycerate dehydrogenase-like enzyme n=1 Tax=Agromyces ramosus TaxID=33879 RepID=A0ABU0RCZ3_9MICO|nr:D-isomer specific 2-hydroxyacid dehydrogenase family protein [Agromyces ramosus]MDQ0895940.1 phosphoglycerate dehydrogenase-like enzyme [Agromyces ramosus]